MRFVFMCCICLSIFFSEAFAFVPGIELSMIKQLYNQVMQMKKTYELLKLQYETQKKQLDELGDIGKAMRGRTKLGNYLNSKTAFDSLKGFPQDWEHAMKGLSGENPSRYKDLMKAYLKRSNTLSAKEMSGYGVREKSGDYEAKLNFVANAAAQSEQAYNMVDTYLNRIKKLSEKIEKTEDAKSIMDLNARLLVEISYLTTEEIRMQSLMNHQLAEVESHHLKSESDAMRFYNYHEKSSEDVKDE